MALVGRQMWWIGCWSQKGLNFKTHELTVQSPALISAAVAISWSGYWEEEGSGFARAGIDWVRFRDGRQKSFFLEPCLFRSNVAAIGWRCEVAHARVRATIQVDYWS